MNEIQPFFEILKYTLPAIVVLIAAANIIKRFLNADVKSRQLEMLHNNQETTVRLRLQALERLVLYVERISPRQLVPRVYQPGMTVADLQGVLIYSIRSEFEHNLSQQIYVSRRVWDMVRNAKEQELNMINNIAKELNPEEPAKELHKRMVDYVLTVEGDLPTDAALQVIHEEAGALLRYGAQG